MRSLFSVTAICAFAVLPAVTAGRVKTANGMVESTAAAKDGVRSFKGIPYAQPPVGDLRWREPNLTRAVSLPEGHDPNSFFAQGGDPHQFQCLLEAAR